MLSFEQYIHPKFLAMQVNPPAHFFPSTFRRSTRLDAPLGNQILLEYAQLASVLWTLIPDTLLFEQYIIQTFLPCK